VIERHFYVYAIYVDGVLRYIGKGSNGRLYVRVIEARRINRRRAHGAKTDRTSTNFYRKLAEAMRGGATITEQITDPGLSELEAYKIERMKIEAMHQRNPGQLWNTIDERFIGIAWEEFQRQRGRVLRQSARARITRSIATRRALPHCGA
jgi:hypothetical protein